MENSLFPIADGRIKFVARRSGTENIHFDTGSDPIRGEESKMIFLENQKGLSPPLPQDSLPDAGEARLTIFGPVSGNFIYRHHVEPRVKLYSPREESFPIPLKYIDVSRTTHTNLDVMQEKPHRWPLEYRWIKRFVWFLDRFRSVHSIKMKKPPEGFLWSGERLTKRQVNIQARSFMARTLERISQENAKLREKHKWAIKKPKLDNARRLRGIYFIDPGDMEFKEISKMQGENWKHQWLQLCLARFAREASMEKPVARLMISSLKFACILEASESTRMAYGRISTEIIMRTTSQEAGDDSLQHDNLVHKFIPMPQAMKMPAAEAAVDKEWEKLEKDFGVELDKSQKVRDWSDRWSKKRRALQFILHHKWTSVTWRMPNWRQSTKNTKGRVVSPRCYCKRWFRILCSIHRTRIISVTNDGSQK